MKIALIIPTYNGGTLFAKCLECISSQTIIISQKIVIDSSSTDNTALLAKEAGFDTYIIDKNNFDHGGTRNNALGYVDSDIVVFMTQDALLNDNQAIENLIEAFSDSNVHAAYGRQLPHESADLLSCFGRVNSYKETSYITNLTNDYPKGFRKAFMSNSFAAYRIKSLNALGGFPKQLILGEDSYTAAKLLCSGMSVAYVAKACVKHSHNYKIIEEFKRYFDTGVFHCTQKWMIDELGSVEGEGVKFALGQMKYVVHHGAYHLLPVSFMSSAAKYIGYKLGRNYHKLPLKVCLKFSMYNSYFKRLKNN